LWGIRTASQKSRDSRSRARGRDVTIVFYLHQMTMSSNKKSKSAPSATIATNRQARHEYFLEQNLEVGIALEGWEVKSLRESRINLKESYVMLHHGEAYLHGAHISPLPSASTHVSPDPVRNRKLLLHRNELNRLIGAVERRGYSVLPTRMYWKMGRAKLEIALGRGKKQHDKRATERDRDWAREKERVLKTG
jgi:SsrA-binding protein